MPIQAPLSPLEKTLSQAKLESSNNAQRVDSSTAADSSNDYFASAECMDCHDFASAKSRNDRNTPILNTPQAQLNLDSSKSPSDSKILDEKCGLQGKSQGSYLEGNDRPEQPEIANLSRKAESTSQAQKPTPKLEKVDSSTAAIPNKPAQDSTGFDKTAQNVFSQNATRRQDFGDKNGALLWRSRAHTRAYVTAESPQQSPFLAQKPTPKPSKAESSSQTQKPSQRLAL